jgi:hypothetical protein
LILNFVVPHFDAESHLVLFGDVIEETGGAFVVQLGDGRVEIILALIVLVIVQVLVNVDAIIAVRHGYQNAMGNLQFTPRRRGSF